MGSVVEWSDRTAEVAIEREIAEVVESAEPGTCQKACCSKVKPASLPLSRSN